LSALFDTSIVLDYLRGTKPADAAFERFPHRALTVESWIEVMRAAPERLAGKTRDFLHTFDRIPIDEAVADRALALMQKHGRLKLRHALPWAAAQIRNLIYVTVDFPKLDVNDERIWVPYRRHARRAKRQPRG
jgi:predicted nucleic acid-binding protein